MQKGWDRRAFHFHPIHIFSGNLKHHLFMRILLISLPASVAVKEDMEADHPMDRLVCGDVGFGKTEIAIRAAFKAASDSKQTAVLVPTTILALQHYKTFSSQA